MRGEPFIGKFIGPVGSFYRQIFQPRRHLAQVANGNISMQVHLEPRRRDTRRVERFSSCQLRSAGSSIGHGRQGRQEARGWADGIRDGVSRVTVPRDKSLWRCAATVEGLANGLAVPALPQLAYSPIFSCGGSRRRDWQLLGAYGAQYSAPCRDLDDESRNRLQRSFRIKLHE
jgi:hypothetical protein